MTDPEDACTSLQEGMREVLDIHAPKRVVQNRNQHITRISPATRKLKWSAARLKREAKQTNNPNIWAEFRRVRNEASKSQKNDEKLFFK